jgi:hypothetical protein
MASIRNIPPNRVVALLTPLVFAPLAGAISVAAADVAPGVNIDEGSLTAIFIAGATIAFGKAAQWTKGWQAFEHDGAAAVAAAAVEFPGEGDDELDDDELELPFEDDIDAELDDADVDHELMALLTAPEE